MPSILIATTFRWDSSARLGAAFGAASCRVEMVCPRNHPAARSRFTACLHPYNPLWPLHSLRTAIAAAAPDLIIPCDDRAVSHLRQLHAEALSEGLGSAAIAALIERSTGPSSVYSQIAKRSFLIALAREEGIAAPETEIVAKPEELARSLARFGLPAVLKTDGSWGGEGVALVRDEREAVTAYRRLAAPPDPVMTVLQALWRWDAHHLMSVRARKAPIVNLQRFIRGRPATSAVACWHGELVAAIHADVLQLARENGPATVVRRIDCAQMDDAARRLARRLGLSGVYGLDYIREDGTGKVHLIELNARATQICHLPLGPGRDIAAALTACMADQPVRPRAALAGSDIIALFPQEWRRDPNSTYLQTAHHDLPWDDPGLMRPWLKRNAPRGRTAQEASLSVSDAAPGS